MVFGSCAYSVLVVSAAAKFNDTIDAMLPDTDYAPIRFVSSIAAAKRAMLERSYDLVIINTPLPDDFGTKFAIDICAGKGTVALLLVRTEVCEEISAKVQRQGVFTLAKPTSAQMLVQSLKWMTTARERLRRLEQKTATMEEKMEEIRLVNRAKWLLIENLKMSEGDAHHYIEKQAMDRCVSKREIAEGVIRTYT